MATAPVPYQSALIESLRAASPGFTSNNPGVTLLPNQPNSALTINFLRGPRTGLANNPPAFTWPTAPPAPAPSPTPAPPPSGGGDPIVIGPGPAPMPAPAPLPPISPPGPPAPDDLFVGPPAPDDLFVGPPAPDDLFVGPPAPDDLFVGPPAPDDLFVGPPAPVAEPFPVPDPDPVNVVDLPPLLPDDGSDFVGPMPDDFVGPMPDDFVGPPEPPEYDEIPEGEIPIGPPGSSQPARDAIDQIGDITEVGDPLDELDDIELPIPEIELPETPPPETQYDEIPEGEIEIGPPGSSQPARDAIDEIGDITQVGDPLDELGEIDLVEVLLDVPPAPVFEGPGPDVGPPPLFDDDSVPDYTDDLGTPIYDEIPQGEIEIGPPGSSQPARDAINQIGDITELGDPLEELGQIDLDEVLLDVPPVPESLGPDVASPAPDATETFAVDDPGEVIIRDLPPIDEADSNDNVAVPDYIDDLWGPDVGPPAPNDAGRQEMPADASAPVDDVITPDYAEDLWAAVDEVDTPDYTQDMWPAIDDLTAQDTFEMMLFDLMAQELLTGGGGGGGGPSNNFNILSYE